MEVLIFLVCWVYQLGIDEVAATGAVVDIPFPWKMYFTVSFIAPVAVTFLTGIVVVGFNSFLYGRRGEPIFKEDSQDATAGRLARIANFCLKLPFLFLLLLLGVLAGVAYNMGEIVLFLGRYFFHSALAEFVSLDRHAFCQFAASQNLDSVLNLLQDAFFYQQFGRNLGTGIKAVQISDIQRSVDGSEDICESALRQTPVKRHLTALEAESDSAPASRFLTVHTATAGFSLAGGCTQ